MDIPEALQQLKEAFEAMHKTLSDWYDAIYYPDCDTIIQKPKLPRPAKKDYICRINTKPIQNRKIYRKQHKC